VAVPVVVYGSNFGATQGSSTVKFNGTTATPTEWTDTRITAPVPAGATTGNLVVTVANQPSNGVPFTLLVAGTLGGAVTQATGGTPIPGATVQAVLIGAIKGSGTTNGSGAYTIPGLDPGTYDIRISASGFSNELRRGIVITSSGNSTPGALDRATGPVVTTI
jgi:hypothetical protein